MFEFIAAVFNTFVVQPIFNLLAVIYALIPGHNFGLAIVIFTVIIRLLLWPLVRKQLHQAKLMRRIQPELKKIAKQTAGNRQKQALMQMELYKERGINPFASLGVALMQLPILIGLYIGLQRVSKDPREIINFAYPFVQNLPFMEQLSRNINLFDDSLFGLVDLSRAALEPAGVYVPAMIIVIASAVIQYFQAKQLMPNDKDARSLRTILREAGAGKQADPSEITAASTGIMRYLLPVMIFIVTVRIASALSLYWFVGGLVAFIQQSIVLREDGSEMEQLSKPDAALTESREKRQPVKQANKQPAAQPGLLPQKQLPQVSLKKPSLAGLASLGSLTRTKKRASTARVVSTASQPDDAPQTLQTNNGHKSRRNRSRKRKRR